MTLEEIIKQRLAEATEQSKEIQIDEEFDSIDTYSLEQLEEFMVSEEFEQLDEISGKLLGSYIQKARGDIANKNQHGKELDANPKVAKLKAKLSDYYDRSEYTKSGASKHRKAIDSTHQKITDTKKDLDPSYPESISTYKRNKGVEKAAKKLQYGKLTEAELDAMSQEEFDAIDEEQLDELSKQLLGRYINKANFSGGMADFKHGKAAAKKLTRDVQDEKTELQMQSDKRASGISTAVKKLTKEDTASSQVASLLEAEGLSDEFKLQAVTIFEAAVTDRVLQLEEGLKEEFESNLAEAKQEMNTNIDGFLSEAIQQWKQDNEVAIKSNFKSQLAESFMDGLMSLLQEHSIDLPAEKEDALTVALSEVDKLNEEAESKQTEIEALTEQLNTLKAEKLLESYKEKMTVTEFDRFVQLTESIKFTDEAQYEKQLNIVQENFGSKSSAKKAEVVINEEITPVVPEKIVTESTSNMDLYVKHLTAKL